MQDAESKAKPSHTSRPTVADAIADARTSLRLLRAILSRLLRGMIGGVPLTGRMTVQSEAGSRLRSCWWEACSLMSSARSASRSHIAAISVRTALSSGALTN